MLIQTVRFRCWLSPSFLLSGMLLAIGNAPVVVSQLWTATSEEQAATAGGTIESTALPDARSIEQREAGGSTGERQHSVGSVLALAHHGGAEWR